MGILLAIGCLVIILAGAFSCGAVFAEGGVPGVIMGVLLVAAVIYGAIAEEKKQGTAGQKPCRPPWISKKGDGNIRFYDEPFRKGRKPPWAP